MTPSGSANASAPRVAVVIPCYNDGEFVGEAIASALDQEPCEIVVVDDGSSDAETLRVLAEVTEPIQVIRQDNAGLSAARMTGVTATSARYVQPLDADDLLVPGAISKLADTLDRRPEINAVWGLIEAFGARHCVYTPGPDIDPWRLSYIGELPATPMLRREPLVAVGGWDMGSGYEDWDLWMKAAEAGWHGAFLEEVTLRYREHQSVRMFDEAKDRHSKLLETLRERHPALYTHRPMNRRSSPSRLAVKLAWSSLDRMSLLSDQQRARLLLESRELFEPWLAPSDRKSPPKRALDKARRVLGRSDEGSARVRG